MRNKDFSDILEDALIEWRSRQTKNRQSVSLNKFAEYLGVSRPVVSHWLNEEREPTNESINIIISPLVALLGNSAYDDLGLARPDPLLTYVTNYWDELPPEIQHQIKETIDHYLEGGQSDDKIAPEADPA